jgi:tetratricopeptide (TPR) repeat protein
VDPSPVATIAVPVALLVATLAIFVLLGRATWRLWQPARHLLAGRYTEARRAADVLERSWLRVLPGVRDSSCYARAAALHLDGALEEALDALAPLAAREPAENLRYAALSLEAATLVLLDRDLHRARALLDEAAKIQTLPEDLLLRALVEQALGDDDGGAATFARAGERRRGSASPVGVRVMAIFHALRGTWLERAGRTEEAERDLTAAARSPIDTIYVRRARARARRSEVDGPTSLAPQVVSTLPE